MENPVFVIDVTDKRNQYLAEDLRADGYKVDEYDIRKSYNDSAVKYIYIFAPATVIDMNIAETIMSGSALFCVFIDNIIGKYLSCKDVKVIKLFDDEILAMQNAYLTAEGSMAYIIQNTHVSLKNSNILILGYGRLGKTLTKLLKDIDATVYVGTNPVEEIAQAKVVANYVCNISNCKKHFPYFNVIVNTVPAKILNLEELSHINRDCFILDLASNPGGLDYDAAAKLGLNTMHALGVPGKTSPKTAAEYIRESIYKTILK